jgi:hypothetical protein
MQRKSLTGLFFNNADLSKDMQLFDFGGKER